jgi:hypothetical protein
MAELLNFPYGFGIFGGIGPDDCSTPNHPIPDWQSTPMSDPLGDFNLRTGYPNDTPNAVESRRFRITEGSATGQAPGPKRNSDF